MSSYTGIEFVGDNLKVPPTSIDLNKTITDYGKTDNHNQVEADYESDGCESVSSFKTAYTSVLDINFNSVPLHPHEINSMHKKIQCVVVIRQIDETYQSALSDIQDQSVISMLLVEPSFYVGKDEIALIVIATALNTYIFDIQCLGNIIYDDLRLLLESEYPRKIVHYGDRAVEQLSRIKSPIKLNGISDTFVNLCTVLQRSFPCTLPEAISLVFGVPLSKLHCNGLGEACKAIRFLDTRPLPISQVRYLATMAIFQEKLHDRLLHSCICNKVQEMSLNFSDTLRKNKKRCSVALKMSPKSNYGTRCIDLNFKVSELHENLPSLREIDVHEQKLYQQFSKK